MIHLIYLCAGFSSRYGANKLFEMVNGDEMYRVLLKKLLEECRTSDDLTLTVVTQYSRIIKEMNSLFADQSEMGGTAERADRFHVIRNLMPERGISSSMHTGLLFAIDKFGQTGSDSAVFFNADMPYLSKRTISGFMHALREDRPPLAAVSIGGQMRNPCAFSEAYYPELLLVTGDKGGKEVLVRHRKKVLLFEAESEEELEDIDTK